MLVSPYSTPLVMMYYVAISNHRMYYSGTYYYFLGIIVGTLTTALFGIRTTDTFFSTFFCAVKIDFNQITVGEIIDNADVGRATFYSHFETKDFLLKEFCEELFCHIFDAENNSGHEHKHIFECDGSDSVFLHLLQHLRKNDNNILTLLSSQNNELFLRYFRSNIEILVEEHLNLFESQKDEKVPLPFWKNHIVSTFVETIRWWIKNDMKESPEMLTDYFLKVV